MPKPFRFGIQTLQSFDSRRGWIEMVRKIEDLGYWGVTVPDHFYDYLAPTVALMAAADATTSLRIGGLVWCNDYRHPAVFAKEAATLDLLSEGRLELGIGAGWVPADYEQAGLTLDPPAIRVDRFEEAIQVLQGLLTGGPFSFEGDHYHITAMTNSPNPVQRPHPPFLIGGGGPRMLRVAARYADIVGINPNLSGGVLGPEIGPDITAQRYAQKIEWIRQAAGERFDALELNVFCLHVAFGDAGRVTGGLGGRLGLTEAQALDSPIALVGTPDQMAEAILARDANDSVSRASRSGHNTSRRLHRLSHDWPEPEPTDTRVGTAGRGVE